MLVVSNSSRSAERRRLKCPGCNDFLLYCYCHNFRIIFTDGACTNNGRPEAKAGIGVAYGNDDKSQLFLPITDVVDEFPLRSNQRAELCAARSGVEFLSKANTQHSEDEAVAWIIATDSEYVVKRMTEWLPTWKRNGWRTSKGTKPANLDLFIALDDVVMTLEAKNIRFWHIPRGHNKLADRIAKAAANYGDEASV
ncbi:ribonuclease H-like domain-containing protein [Bipolaris maydis]|nr:ribonuclease H-like domain-containing protein [Bipolaris maydis]